MRDRIYGETTKRQEEALDRMYAASQHLLELVNDVLRSEERRVGKECRSLCDWSSDVCSSDLDARPDLRGDDEAAGGGAGPDVRGQPAPAGAGERRAEIGRASCRERV